MGRQCPCAEAPGAGIAWSEVASVDTVTDVLEIHSHGPVLVEGAIAGEWAVHDLGDQFIGA